MREILFSKRSKFNVMEYLYSILVDVNITNKTMTPAKITKPDMDTLLYHLSKGRRPCFYMLVHYTAR